MKTSHKIRVAVLRGGPSSEYDVSLKTGDAVLKHLPEKYHGLDVFISRDGAWHLHGVEKKPADILKHVDVVFVALHGHFGEDGKIQKILEHFKMPFTGTKSFESAISMNKDLTKKKIAHLKEPLPKPLAFGKVRMAYHKVFSREDILREGLHQIFRMIPHPSIVKPVSSGSSIGVTVVNKFDDLEEAVLNAFDHSENILIEEYIEGKEVTCGVIDHFRDEQHYVLMPVEVIPHKESPFFDYNAKYHGKSDEVCPANLSAKTKKLIQEAAKAIHKDLGLRHYSRTDFIVHPKRGLYFLEVNTLPGLTPESLLPKSLKAVGSSLPEFLDHVITLAREGR